MQQSGIMPKQSKLNLFTSLPAASTDVSACQVMLMTPLILAVIWVDTNCILCVQCLAEVSVVCSSMIWTTQHRAELRHACCCSADTSLKDGSGGGLRASAPDGHSWLAERCPVVHAATTPAGCFYRQGHSNCQRKSSILANACRLLAGECSRAC